MKKIPVLLLLLCLLACESNKSKAGRFYLMGNEALGAGDYKEAIRLYTEAIRKSAELKEVWNNRGVAHYREGRYTEAIRDYTHAIRQIDARFADAWRNRADAHYKAAQYEEALKDLQFLQQIWPDSAFVHFKKGLVLMAQKQYLKAVESFKELLKTDSAHVEAMINIANGFYLYGAMKAGKFFEQAGRYLQKAEKLNPAQGEIYNTRALMKIYAKDYKTALAQVNKALETDINNAYYRNNRGFIYLMTGRADEAEKDINFSIKADPQNGWAYRNKGIFYFVKEKYEAALRNLEQAGLYDDAIPLLHYYRGATLLKLGRKDEACAELQKSTDVYEGEGRGLFEQNCD